MLQMRRDHSRNTRAVEGIPQCEGAVKNTPERIDVGSVVDRLAMQLLGREEVDRAGQCARVVKRLLGWSRHDFCESEIQQLHPQIAGFGPGGHDIRRFDVPVHHAQRVRRAERVEALSGELAEHRGVHRRFQFVQARAVDEFHNHEHIFVGWQEIENRNDVRVLQAGEALGFVEGSCGIAERVGCGVNAFDGHMAVQKLVIGEVNSTFPAGAELAVDHIAPANH